MKINKKAPWYRSPNFGPQPATDQLSPGGVLYCHECDTIWELEGARSCPSCETDLQRVLPSYPVLSPDQTLVKRYYCPTHGHLTAEQLAWIWQERKLPKRTAVLRCKTCNQEAQLAGRRLSDVGYTYAPAAFSGAQKLPSLSCSCGFVPTRLGPQSFPWRCPWCSKLYAAASGMVPTSK